MLNFKKYRVIRKFAAYEGADYVHPGDILTHTHTVANVLILVNGKILTKVHAAYIGELIEPVWDHHNYNKMWRDLNV
jgi:hypothetical protein